MEENIKDKIKDNILIGLGCTSSPGVMIQSYNVDDVGYTFTRWGIDNVCVPQLYDIMIEFAKYHVEQALNKVGDVVNPEIGKYSLTDKEQILKAYPLDLIK